MDGKIEVVFFSNQPSDDNPISQAVNGLNDDSSTSVVAGNNIANGIAKVKAIAGVGIAVGIASKVTSYALEGYQVYNDFTGDNLSNQRLADATYIFDAINPINAVRNAVNFNLNRTKAMWELNLLRQRSGNATFNDSRSDY